MESFFGSEKTSSSDYMEEGEEEEDSSSSSDEEVQRNMPPSTLMQSPATSKKQSKKSGKPKESKFLPESEIVPSGSGVPLPDTRDSSSLNVMRERVKQNNMVDPLPIFLSISVIDRPPVDPHTELAAEYEHVDTYKTAMCWVYAGLTDEEAKVLALDHNIDSDFRLEMSFIQKIRFFHNECVDTIKRGGNVDDNFRVALCEKCGLEVKKKGGRGASQKPNTKQYDNYFQLAFRDGKIWDLQEEIFKLHESTGCHQADPLDFEQFLSRCRLEKRRRQPSQSFEITLGLSLYIPDNVDESPSHWCVHEGRVEEMSTFVIPRFYTLAIADAPYGFSVPNSVNDDIKYGVSAYKKVIKAFGKKITTCDSWSLVFFHAHDRITAVQKAFTDSNMTCQMLTWIKPNIHGYKLDRLSWACEFATIGFYSSLDEFQEVGMKSIASDPRFFDTSGEPQRPIGSEKVREIVDLVDFEPDNVEVEDQKIARIIGIRAQLSAEGNCQRKPLVLGDFVQINFGAVMLPKFSQTGVMLLDTVISASDPTELIIVVIEPQELLCPLQVEARSRLDFIKLNGGHEDPNIQRLRDKIHGEYVGRQLAYLAAKHPSPNKNDIEALRI
ncbi:hypothetical protein L7F22_000626 [Adiantum nelumboides]|nr:hypothetical protein [Adiantum nelumboides]